MLLSDLILNNIVYARAYPNDILVLFLYRGALWSYAAFGLIVMMVIPFLNSGVDFTKVIFGAFSAR
jgi:hypothetical protein